MFTTLNASIMTIVFKKINLNYAIYIQILTFFATFPGIFFQEYCIKSTKRVSTVILFGIGVLVTNLVLITLLNIPLM